MNTKLLMKVADELNIAPTTLRSALKDSRLNGVKIGRDLYIYLDAKYEAFIANHRPKGQKK